MPRKPTNIIQKVAPGPPVPIAIATPAIFPNPTVAERAVVNAWKWVTSPTCSELSYFPRTKSIACLNRRIFTNRIRKVKKRAPPSNHAITRGISIPGIGQKSSLASGLTTYSPKKVSKSFSQLLGTSSFFA